MNKVKFVLFSVGISLALAFIFGCSSDSPSGPSGGEPPPSPKPSSSSAYTPPPPPSSSSVYIPPPPPSSSSVYIPPPPPSSSSSVIVGTQYYDVTLGYWSASCPSLNDYPGLVNNVMSINDDSRSLMQSCLINPEYYTQNTGSQVANFLTTNGLSGHINDFDSRIAASSYKAAYLIYVNTSNYYRVLIISYSGTNLSPSSSSNTPTSPTCALNCLESMVGSIAPYIHDFCGYGMSIFSAETLLRIYDTCGCTRAEVEAEVDKLCR